MTIKSGPKTNQGRSYGHRMESDMVMFHVNKPQENSNPEQELLWEYFATIEDQLTPDEIQVIYGGMRLESTPKKITIIIKHQELLNLVIDYGVFKKFHD